MKFKKVVSLTALLSFLVVLLNSVALYIAPQGRVANWGDWRFLGLSKTQWSDQHIIVGLLFILALFLHIYYNWTLIVTYLKNKFKQIKVVTIEFNIALALTLVFTLGAWMDTAPFKWVVDFSESIKENAAVRYGQPPYGRAESATLEEFTTRMEFNLEDSLAKLNQAGIKNAHPERTLLEIAGENRTSPQHLLTLIQPEESSRESTTLPAEPPKGFGSRSLAGICEEYRLELAVVLKALAAQDIVVESDATIKQIRESHGLSSTDIYAVIQRVADAQGDGDEK